MGDLRVEGEVAINTTEEEGGRRMPELVPELVDQLVNQHWSYGGTNFWVLCLFGPLVVFFVVAYIVHLVHVGFGGKEAKAKSRSTLEPGISREQLWNCPRNHGTKLLFLNVSTFF